MLINFHEGFLKLQTDVEMKRTELKVGGGGLNRGKKEID